MSECVCVCVCVRQTKSVNGVAWLTLNGLCDRQPDATMHAILISTYIYTIICSHSQEPLFNLRNPHTHTHTHTHNHNHSLYHSRNHTKSHTQTCNTCTHTRTHASYRPQAFVFEREPHTLAHCGVRTAVHLHALLHDCSKQNKYKCKF